jgi:hypothetical protein
MKRLWLVLAMVLGLASSGNAQNLPTNFENFLFFPPAGCAVHTPQQAPLTAGAICSDIPTGAFYQWNGKQFVLSGGEQWSVNAGAGQVTATTTYFGGQGNLTNATTEAASMRTPVFLQSFVHNLNCYTSAAPGGATSDAFTMRSATSFGTAETVTPLTCTVSGTNTTCSDLTHMVTLAAGSFFEFQDQTTGVPAARSIACSYEVDKY